MAYYLAFPIETELQLRLKKPEENAQGLANAANKEKLNQSICALIDQGLFYYFTRPLDLIDLNPTVKKSALAGMKGVERSIHLLVEKVVKSLNQHEIESLYDYLSTITLEDCQKWFCAFLLQEELKDEVALLIHSIKSQESIPDMRERLHKTVAVLTSTGVDYFFSRPLALLELGLIVRKSSELGIKAIEHGMLLVIKQLFKAAKGEDLNELALYVETLLVEQKAA